MRMTTPFRACGDAQVLHLDFEALRVAHLVPISGSELGADKAKSEPHSHMPPAWIWCCPRRTVSLHCPARSHGAGTGSQSTAGLLAGLPFTRPCECKLYK